MHAAKLKAAAAALALLTAPLCALAADAPSDAPQAAQPPPNVLTALESEDIKVVSAAFQARSTGGYPALDAHTQALSRTLANSPPSYPMEETRNGVLVSRATGPACLLAMLKGAAARTQAVCAANIYPDAALLLGAYYVEQRDMNQALVFLDKGLSIQPNSPKLIGERNVVYLTQRRFAEVVAASTASLAAYPITDPQTNALLLRNRGIALIELMRLDEAEADFNASLKLVPDHAGARSELTYIAQLRAGRPLNAPLGPVTTMGQAAAGTAPNPPPAPPSPPQTPM